MSGAPPPRLREKAQVLDEHALDRALTRIAHEILERNGGAKDLAFVGLRTRGVTIAVATRPPREYSIGNGPGAAPETAATKFEKI